MQISLPEAKILKIKHLVDTLLHKYETGQKVPVREVAQVTGNFAHAIVTHGPFMRIVSRNTNHNLGLNTTLHGWEASMLITHDMYTELKLCIRYVDSFNGQPLKLESAHLDVIYPSQARYHISCIPPQFLKKPLDVFFSGISINFVLFKAYIIRELLILIIIF